MTTLQDNTTRLLHRSQYNSNNALTCGVIMLSALSPFVTTLPLSCAWRKIVLKLNRRCFPEKLMINITNNDNYYHLFMLHSLQQQLWSSPSWPKPPLSLPNSAQTFIKMLIWYLKWSHQWWNLSCQQIF